METVQWQQLLADFVAAATVAPATPADTGYEVAVQTDISMVDDLLLHLQLQALHAINRASHICGWRTLLVLRVPPRSVSLGRRAIVRFWWRIWNGCACKAMYSQGVRPLLCNAPKTANGYVWMQMIAWLDHYRSFLGPLRRLASVVGLLPFWWRLCLPKPVLRSQLLCNALGAILRGRAGALLPEMQGKGTRQAGGKVGFG